LGSLLELFLSPRAGLWLLGTDFVLMQSSTATACCCHLATMKKHQGSGLQSCLGQV